MFATCAHQKVREAKCHKGTGTGTGSRLELIWDSVLHVPDCLASKPFSFDTTSLVLSTLMIEAVLSSESSVLTRATWRHISEDGIHNSHRREDLTSCRSVF
jgi:hypothetical protein